MTTLPFFLATTFPVLLTVATFLFDVEYVTFSWLVNGEIKALILYDFPFFNTLLRSATVTFEVFTVPFWTFSFAYNCFPLANFTVKTAFPALTAVILPFFVTVKIFLLLLV